MVKINNNTKSVQAVGSGTLGKIITLIPGINEIAKEHYHFIKDHPVIRDRFERGDYSLVNHSKDAIDVAAKEEVPVPELAPPVEESQPEANEESDSEASTDDVNSSPTTEENSDEKSPKKGDKKKGKR